MATVTQRVDERWRRRLVMFALGGSVGCGDAQVGSSYHDEPLWRFRGDLQASAFGIHGAANLRLALFFSPHDLNETQPARYIEHHAASIAVTVPSSYVLNVFAPPGPEHLLQDPSGVPRSYGLGRLFAYRDLDGDQRHSEGEPFLGNEGPTASLYVAEALPAAQTPTAGALPSGLHRVKLPQSCGRPPPLPTDDGTCGVPLGEVCTKDIDCPGGACIVQRPNPWHEGFCAINDPPPKGCRPAQAAYWSITPMSAEWSMGLRGRYLRRCQVDSDCFRPSEKHHGSLICDPGLLGCVPAPSGFGVLSVGSMVPIGPFCAQ